jgi:hypothetical protein
MLPSGYATFLYTDDKFNKYFYVYIYTFHFQNACVKLQLTYLLWYISNESWFSSQV